MTMKCAGCKEKECVQGKDCTEIAKDAKAAYEADTEVLKSLKVATLIESRYYMQKTRMHRRGNALCTGDGLRKGWCCILHRTGKRGCTALWHSRATFRGLFGLLQGLRD